MLRRFGAGQHGALPAGESYPVARLYLVIGRKAEIRGEQLLDYQQVGPRIGDHVMHAIEQHVALVGPVEQLDAEQRPFGEIERLDRAVEQKGCERLHRWFYRCTTIIRSEASSDPEGRAL